MFMTEFSIEGVEKEELTNPIFEGGKDQLVEQNIFRQLYCRYLPNESSK